MGFAQAVRTCLRKYVTFTGRAARAEFWWFALFCLLGGIVAGLIDFAVFGPPRVETAHAPGAVAVAAQSRGPLQGLFSLAVFLPSLAAGWRRMHDTGRSGLYLFFPLGVMIVTMLLAPLAGLSPFGGTLATPPALPLLWIVMLIVALSPLLVLWWLTRPSQPGSNPYGPNPYEVTP